MTKQVTTIRLSDDLRQQVDSLVEATGRTMNYHVQRAVEEYVAREAWQVQRIQAALVQAHAGHGTDLEAYVEQGIEEGTLTREGYARAMAEESADGHADMI